MSNKNWTENWSKMWTGPTITSFGRSHFTNNYDKEYFDFWFEKIKVNSGHYLDLCCGNGALTWLISDICVKKGLVPQQVLGVDLASINPFKVLNKNPDHFPEIAFKGEVSIEKTGIESSSQDFVGSQYGIEYSDLTLSINEVDRILKNGGTLSLIMHSETSAILKDTTVARECRRPIDVLKLHDLFLNLDERFSGFQDKQAIENDSEEQQLVDKINQAINTLKVDSANFSDNSKSNLRTYIQSLVSAFYQKPAINRNSFQDVSEAQRATVQSDLYVNGQQFNINISSHNPNRRVAIERAIYHMETTLCRLEELDDAALSEKEYEELLLTLINKNYSIKDKGKLFYEGKIEVGYKLVAEKSA